MIATSNPVNWDVVLEGYGPEAKQGMLKILRDYEIEDDDAVAALIASMFVSQLDTMKAFKTLSVVIEEGKDSLSDEFKSQIISLRGIISYAEEHLIETSKDTIEHRQKDLLDVVRAGISTAIQRTDQSRQFRSTTGVLLLMGVVGMISVLSAVSGAMLVRSATPNPPIVTNTVNDPVWAEIQAINKEIVEICLENPSKLENRCVIDLP